LRFPFLLALKDGFQETINIEVGKLIELTGYFNRQIGLSDEIQTVFSVGFECYRIDNELH